MSDDAVGQELADNAMREKMAEIERIERDIERRSAELSEGDANEAVELALAIAIEILDNSLADEKRKRTLETMRTLLVPLHSDYDSLALIWRTEAGCG